MKRDNQLFYETQVGTVTSEISSHAKLITQIKNYNT
ncbi:hypothetical protein MiYa_04739 [Microcystis aeruginosa NIES-2519]|uniref:Uncharacterized protein n=1 Tax=Microcystis aeruginosa NIES-2519 TaxID=2303981 RepID=A0A5A5RAX4_MICAE|nr:hypothetical protein MiYa_04739 [Microcystis aeruginosa NIES-2519]